MEIYSKIWQREIKCLTYQGRGKKLSPQNLPKPPKKISVSELKVSQINKSYNFGDCDFVIDCVDFQASANFFGGLGLLIFSALIYGDGPAVNFNLENPSGTLQTFRIERNWFARKSIWKSRGRLWKCWSFFQIARSLRV